MFYSTYKGVIQINKILIGCILGLVLNGFCIAEANSMEAQTGGIISREAQTGSIICNKTSTAFHFYKSGAYQANTSDDHSADFILDPESCTNIHFWVFAQDNGFDNDDALDFTDRNGAGMFTIKGSHGNYMRGEAAMDIVLGQVVMNDFYITEDKKGFCGLFPSGPKWENIELSIHSK